MITLWLSTALDWKRKFTRPDMTNSMLDIAYAKSFNGYYINPELFERFDRYLDLAFRIRTSPGDSRVQEDSHLSSSGFSFNVYWISNWYEVVADKEEARMSVSQFNFMHKSTYYDYVLTDICYAETTLTVNGYEAYYDISGAKSKNTPISILQKINDELVDRFIKRLDLYENRHDNSEYN